MSIGQRCHHSSTFVTKFSDRWTRANFNGPSKWGHKKVKYNIFIPYLYIFIKTFSKWPLVSCNIVLASVTYDKELQVSKSCHILTTARFTTTITNTQPLSEYYNIVRIFTRQWCTNCKVRKELFSHKIHNFNPSPIGTWSDLVFATSIEQGQPAHLCYLTSL